MKRYVFGYGSLVNSATHDYRDLRQARLPGWQRLWCTTNARDLAFLSAEPAKDAFVDGVIAQVSEAAWAELDIREASYDRHDVTDRIDHGLGGSVQIVTYSVPRSEPAPAPRPILLSYLDVVLQGYLRATDEKLAAQFFDTTLHWDGGIVNDRAAPMYPRAQPLSPQETAFVDAQIKAHGVRVTRPD